MKRAQADPEGTATEAPAVCVGVFWVDVKRAEIYADKSSLCDAIDYGGHRIHPHGHYDVWPTVSRLNPAWAGLEYEDVPRGRVVYRTDPERPGFVVYAAAVCARPRFRQAIVQAFGLPPGAVEFDFADEHYRLPGPSTDRGTEADAER